MIEIIPSTKRVADLADAVVSRTWEVYEYDRNIANYQALTATLPAEAELDAGGVLQWPGDLAPLRGMDPQQAAILAPNDRLEVLAGLQQFDRCSALLSTETVERSKTAGILSAVLEQLADAAGSQAKVDEALTAAVQRRTAATSS